MTWDATTVLLAVCWMALPAMALRRDLFRRTRGSPTQFIAWASLTFAAMAFVLLRVSASIGWHASDARDQLEVISRHENIGPLLFGWLGRQADTLNQTSSAVQCLAIVVLLLTVVLAHACRSMRNAVIAAATDKAEGAQKCPA